jgi:hypothetical protein
MPSLYWLTSPLSYYRSLASVNWARSPPLSHAMITDQPRTTDHVLFYDGKGDRNVQENDSRRDNSRRDTALNRRHSLRRPGKQYC